MAVNENKKDIAPTKSILWTKNFILIMLTGTSSITSYFFVNSILPKHFENLEISLSLIGVLVGILSITALFMRPFSGMAADRYNKKIILMISIFVIAVCL